MLTGTSEYSVVLSLALTGAFTQAIKVTVGRPRPGNARTLQLYCFVDPLTRPSQMLLIVASQTRGRLILPLAFPLQRYAINQIVISSTTASEASQADIRAVWHLQVPKESALTLISSVFCRTHFFVTIHCGKVAFV